MIFTPVDRVETALAAVYTAEQAGLTLDLHACQLTSGQIRQIVQTLIERNVHTKIKRLDLSNNQLETVPIELIRLVNLKEIFLNKNRLTTFPVFLFSLPCITYLEGNPISFPLIDITFDVLEEKTDFFDWNYPYIHQFSENFSTLHKLRDEVFHLLKTTDPKLYMNGDPLFSEDTYPQTFTFLEDAIHQIVWRYRAYD